MAIINGDNNANSLYGDRNTANEADTLNGLGGDDYLDGLGGVDTLNGGDGNDTLRLRAGDTGFGGAGNDILSIAETGVARADGGTGTDTLRFETSADISAVTLSNIERVAVWGNATMTAAQLSSFQLVTGYSDSYTTGRVLLSQGGVATATLSATFTSYFELFGSATADTISFNASHTGKIYVYAGAGDDRVTGAAGGDDLRGEDGNDVLNGLGGADTLDGGVGIDTLNGGDGNDLLRMRAGDTGNGGNDDDIFAIHESAPGAMNGGAGIDTLRFETSADITGAALTGFERLAAWGNAQMTASQLASFQIVGGYNDNYSSAQVTLTQGGAATVNLSDTLDAGYFRLYGSDGNDAITFAAGYAGRIYAYGGDGNDTITGSDGADMIYGEDGDDRIVGGAGADEIDGGAGVDSLSGGDGNDVIWTRTGDSASGGNGDDILAVRETLPYSLNGGSGTDTLRTETSVDITGTTLTSVEQLWTYGNVTMTAAQLNSFQLVSGYSPSYTTSTITLSQGGTASVNLSPTLSTYFSLTGSAGVDLVTITPAYAGVVYANMGAGADRLAAGAGADQLNGGDGNDTISGLAGNDRIDGQGDNDTLNGGDGDDQVVGGLGADIVRGGAGNDQLAGYYSWTFDGNDNAIDLIYGEDGADTISVSTGDTADGGTGDDILTAAGAATLLGGDGNDLMVASSGNDTINGGAGVDTVSYRNTSTVVIDLAVTTAQNTGNSGTDTISGVENLVGSSGSDTLRGNSGDNVITGWLGNDLIDGRTGTDTASYRDHNAVTVDLRIVGQQNTVGAGLDTLVSIENLIGSGNDDTLTGNAGANVLEGGLGADRLDGQGGSDTASYVSATQLVRVNLGLAGAQNTVGGGLDTLISIENVVGSAFNDTLTGNAGVNRLEGGAGSDTLDGGAGADVMIGGDGSDTYVVDSAGDVTTEAAGAFGVDLVRSSISWTLAANVENLTLTGAAAVNATGNSGANRLNGNDAANTLRDDAGGNDALNGFGGNDRLIAGAGNDVLTGGLGQDELYGGAGADRFVFATKADSLVGAADQLIGYSSGPAFEGAGVAGGDVIDLSGIDANESLAGDQAFVFAVTQAIGTVRAFEVGGVTRILGYVDNVAGADFQIDIQDGTVLASQYAAGDFVL